MPDAIALLRASHDRLRPHLEAMSADEVTGQSYDDDWSFADVASHLGSGAEIFDAFLTAGLEGTAPPSDFAPVWDRWNALSPRDQVASSLSTNDAFVTRLESLTDAQRADFEVPMFGMQAGLPMLLGMRLGEHTFHSWDILVQADPDAVLPPEAVAAMIDTIGPMIGRAMKSIEGGGTVAVATSGPERRFVLDLGEGAQVAESTEGDRAAAMPAEAFLRLVAGRLDAGHTPSSVDAEPAVLDHLRQAFPGF